MNSVSMDDESDALVALREFWGVNLAEADALVAVGEFEAVNLADIEMSVDCKFLSSFLG